MKREPNKQANFRLPASLLEELREVSEEIEKTQTVIVHEALTEKVSRLKSSIQRRREKAEVAA